MKLYMHGVLGICDDVVCMSVGGIAVEELRRERKRYLRSNYMQSHVDERAL